jgi:hypothetical protein
MANQYYNESEMMAKCEVGSIGSQLRVPNLKENVENQLLRSKKETQRLEELLRLLEQNPETQRILELMGNKY